MMSNTSPTTMNSNNTPDSDEAARLEKLRAQLSADIEAMQQKEASLREYELKLRQLVENVSNSQATQNTNQNYVTSGREALDAEWEKYERAHALLEAARRSLTDDRLALKDREEKVMIREQEVARREAWVKAREQQAAAKAEAEAIAAAAPKPKASFTTAPFLAAKNLLSLGKDK
jgi:hypothetical protein